MPSTNATKNGATNTESVSNLPKALSNSSNKPSPCQDLVLIIDNEPTTSSLKIAEYFGKLHFHILEKIKKLECSQEFTDTNFRVSYYQDESGKSNLMYNLTKDGFVFLTMGFTGKRASQFKESYILEFNRMANSLTTTQPTQTVKPLTIDQILALNSKAIESLQAKVQNLEIENKTLAPKAKFIDDTFAVNNTSLTAMNMVAKQIGSGSVALYKLLRDKKVWFYSLNEYGESVNNVNSKYIKDGYFVIKNIGSRSGEFYDKTFATTKGKLFCYNLVKRLEYNLQNQFTENQLQLA